MQSLPGCVNRPLTKSVLFQAISGELFGSLFIPHNFKLVVVTQEEFPGHVYSYETAAYQQVFGEVRKLCIHLLVCVF